MNCINCQLIKEATRVTMTTSSLIDHIVTNTPEKISDSGVIHTGISDHSSVFAIRKISVTKNRENIVKTWQEIVDQSQFCLLLAKLWKKYYMISCIITYPNSICSVIVNLVLENFILQLQHYLTAKVIGI